jgi:acetyl esterase/lipase
MFQRNARLKTMTISLSSRLVETRHALPEDEYPIEQAVLGAVGQHFASFPGSPRETYDALIAQTPLADGIGVGAVDQEAVKGWWVRPKGAPQGKAVLFLHGGAYMLGSAAAYRGFASQIATRTGVATFVVDYPLAPEQPFPAAFDAALAARRWLGAQGCRQVAMVGDSAGGALALATLQEIDASLPDVPAVAVFSPWLDLAFTGRSFNDPKTRDLIFQPHILTDAAAAYLNGADPRDRRASPLYALPARLPPLAIQVGADELLLDDAIRYANAAAKKGGEVRLDIYEGLHHVFQSSTRELASARRALDDVADFVSGHWT